ncbi:hypothetical protein EG68_09311 [Paragonimus skrjabini miyazakii]|uniref:PNPLA domain-containing protein n=1 Tax=Paragonimus skrjabini miyazakii TaxID=59628 RepID=A0A8S9YHM6_9TREM|nr:hypothetical protein EG68_09311 [Paragonimus skrjabini miyazakii]
MLYRNPEHQLEEDRYYRDTPSLKHNLSFAGCGFLGLYHVGVCSCLRRCAPHLYHNRPISGASAGAIAAACLLCDVGMAESVQYMCALIKNCRSHLFGPFDPRFKTNEHLREGLDRILPSDAHVLCSGRLSVSLTSCSTGKNIVVTHYKDKEELISAILCSTFIPVFSGFVPAIFRGQPVLDGGFSDNLLCIDRMTITVSPFVGEADISPMDATWKSGYSLPAPQRVEDILGTVSILNNTIRLNWTNVKRILHALWPMTPEELYSLTYQGYVDALRYLTTRGFIACRLHQTPRAFSNFAQHQIHSPRTKSPRYRRNMSTSSLSDCSTTTGKKSLTEKRTPVTRTPSPRSCKSSVRRPAGATDTHLVGSGVGLNVAHCHACYEELHKAHNSSLPTFIRAIILGDGRYRRPQSDYFYKSMVFGGINLVRSMLWWSTSHVYSCIHRAFFLPIFVQLDLLIRCISCILQYHGPLPFCVTQLQCSLNLLQKLKRYASSWESYTGDLFHDYIPPTNSKFRSTVRHSKTLQHSPIDFARRLQSAVFSSTDNLTDFFSFNLMELPTADECGLELLGSSNPYLDSHQFSLSTFKVGQAPSLKNRYRYANAPVSRISFDRDNSPRLTRKIDDNQRPIVSQVSSLCAPSSDPDVSNGSENFYLASPSSSRRVAACSSKDQ